MKEDSAKNVVLLRTENPFSESGSAMPAPDETEKTADRIGVQGRYSPDLVVSPEFIKVNSEFKRLIGEELEKRFFSSEEGLGKQPRERKELYVRMISGLLAEEEADIVFAWRDSLPETHNAVPSELPPDVLRKMKETIETLFSGDVWPLLEGRAVSVVGEANTRKYRLYAKSLLMNGLMRYPTNFNPQTIVDSYIAARGVLDVEYSTLGFKAASIDAIEKLERWQQRDIREMQKRIWPWLGRELNRLAGYFAFLDSPEIQGYQNLALDHDLIVMRGQDERLKDGFKRARQEGVTMSRAEAEARQKEGAELEAQRSLERAATAEKEKREKETRKERMKQIEVLDAEYGDLLKKKEELQQELRELESKMLDWEGLAKKIEEERELRKKRWKKKTELLSPEELAGIRRAVLEDEDVKLEHDIKLVKDELDDLALRQRIIEEKLTELGMSASKDHQEWLAKRQTRQSRGLKPANDR